MENSFSTKISDMDGVEYHSPFYKVGDATTGVGVSNLFYVKLKTENDYNILENLANRYNVEILGNNKLLPLWYTLSCNKESVGDAIEMANVFYESGHQEHSRHRRPHPAGSGCYLGRDQGHL